LKSGNSCNDLAFLRQPFRGHSFVNPAQRCGNDGAPVDYNLSHVTPVEAEAMLNKTNSHLLNEWKTFRQTV